MLNIWLPDIAVAVYMYSIVMFVADINNFKFTAAEYVVFFL